VAKIVKVTSEIEGIKEDLQGTKTHKFQKRNWLLIILIWIFNIACQPVTSILVTGLFGMLLGIILSAVSFFLGIWAVTTIIEKETWHG
jgi:hypothetical protein